MPKPEPADESTAAKDLFESRLDEIDRVILWIARRLNLRGDDEAEFRSWAHLKLIEDDYRILRRFAGRSSLKTYLTTVVQNLGRDYRIARWGRWRPSAVAERMGTTAIELEMLLYRDEFSFDEAAEILRSNHGVRMSRRELADLAADLPQKEKRRFEGDEGLADQAAAETADDGVRQSELRRTRSRLERALGEAFDGLDVEDRLILKMHYGSELTIAAIATALGIEQRQLYSHRDRLLRTLQRHLETSGVEAGEVVAFLRSGSLITVDYGSEKPGDDETRPSNPMRAKVNAEEGE